MSVLTPTRPTLQNATPPGDTIQERFLTFHAENPHIYRLIVHYARMVKAAGYDRYSMDSIFHRVRWHETVETRSTDGFKLNDHFTSRYARLVMDQEPGLEGFFEIRRSPHQPDEPPPLPPEQGLLFEEI